MKRGKYHGKNLSIVFFAIAVLILGAQTALASTLDLLGVGWSKPEVTVLIKPAQAVTPQAVADVEMAINLCGTWGTAGCPQNG
ncbi:MAG: hypothetical protein M1508_12540 [Nitrospirae bacterium]|nr:hypothetical protein [Nitrospirota bacterium]MCL5421073.1 hypothetical protein [Nitrospirota bacterium]